MKVPIGMSSKRMMIYLKRLKVAITKSLKEVKRNIFKC